MCFPLDPDRIVLSGTGSDRNYREGIVYVFDDMGDDRIALTPVNGGQVAGGADVSTIRHPRGYYETCAFGAGCDDRTERYGSRADALAGHDAWVARIRESLSEQAGSQR